MIEVIEKDIRNCTSIDIRFQDQLDNEIPQNLYSTNFHETRVRTVTKQHLTNQEQYRYFYSIFDHTSTYLCCESGCIVLISSNMAAMLLSWSLSLLDWVSLEKKKTHCKIILIILKNILNQFQIYVT